MENNFQFLIYRSAEEDVSINAVVKDESIWLTQQGMAELFGVQKPAISKHLKNIFEEGELDEKVVVSKMETTTHHGALDDKTQRNKLLQPRCHYLCGIPCQLPPGYAVPYLGYRHSQRVYDQGLCAG